MPYIASDIKDMNRRIVYNVLSSSDGLSKAEISRMTGISAPTVIKIIDYLKGLGCVKEVGGGESVLGRKPQLLRFDQSFGYAIGVYFSGVDLKAGIVDFGGNICYTESMPLSNDFVNTITNIFPKIIENFIKQSGISAEKIKGICVGIPGVINEKRKTIELAPLIGIIEKSDYIKIMSQISEYLKMPVFFENDANIAAVGEFAARGYTSNDDLLFITVGKGIGAGIILNGNLRKGNNYLAGELGYMVFDKSFEVSLDKAGWFETNINPDELRKVKNIDRDLLDNISCNIALAIVNLCVPFDINHVVLGRFKTDGFYDQLISRINMYINKFTLQPIKCEMPVCQDPGILGAAHIVIGPAVDDLIG